MARWNIGRSALFVLFSVVVVMLLVVVLPFVDLPDTAFHRGTAPVVVHAQATSARAGLIATAIFQFPSIPEAYRHFQEHPAFAVYSSPNFLPIFLSSLRR